jgi:ABC-type multidrug transport system fused ATPase/permease subunit
VVAASVGAERRALVVPIVAMIVAATLPLAGPQIVRAFVDDAIRGRRLSTLIVLASAYLALAVTAEVAKVVSTFFSSGLAWRTTNRLREQVAEHALHLDMDFHNRHTPGEMIERVDGDLLGLGEFISGFVAQAIGGAVLLLGTIVLVWAANPIAGLSLTALVAIGGLVVFRAQRRVTRYAADFRQATAEMFGAIEERLVAVDDLRANGAGPHAVRRFHEDAARVFNADKQWQLRGGAVLSGTNLLFGIGTAVIVGIGIELLSHHTVTLGTVVLLLQYSALVRQPVDAVIGQAKQLHEAGAAATRVSDLLAEKATITEPASPVRLPGESLSLTFDDVTFAYGDDPPVLHGIRLEILAGRTLGLVGRTGSGKTTMGRLAMRLYDPTAGGVRLGGVDLRDVALDDLRRRVRIVTQEVFLFGTSARDNLSLFDERIDDHALRAALEDVGLGEWLAGLPEGLSTPLGPEGVGLSAGEAQLLSFARVLVANPAVVVLDEPSSRLDAATEDIVHAATDRLLSGRTAIVIAHRLSTLTTVDDIAVIDAGRIIEHGPRETLADDATSAFSRLLAGGRS